MNTTGYPPPSHTHEAACWLTLAATLGLLFSPPLANLAELLLFVVMLASGEMRQKLVKVWRQPLAKAALAFYAITCIGLIYSIAPHHVAVSMWGGWRKLLLIPLALSLFSDPRWKQRFLLIFIGVVTVCAAISFLAWFTHYSFPVPDPEPGILLRNHSTQGMLFGVSAFGAAIVAYRTASRSLRLVMAICVVLLAGNIMLVTTGRSGYIVLLVCTVAMILSQLFGGKRRPGAKAIAGASLAFIAIVAGLALTPTSRERITQAVHELQDYKQEKQVTSMGIRVIFWKNTIALIKERPLIGYGTGAFGTAYGQLVKDRPGLAGLTAGDPHDQYMKIMAEHGLIGLVAFAAMLVAAFLQRPSYPYRLLGLGVLAAWCATSLANSHFSTFTEGTFIYLWLGVMLAAEELPPASAHMRQI